MYAHIHIYLNFIILIFIVTSTLDKNKQECLIVKFHLKMKDSHLHTVIHFVRS